jgi:hypothetical protein
MGPRKNVKGGSHQRFLERSVVKREESLTQLAVTRSKVEDTKRVLESLLEEEEAVVLTGQALDLEIILCRQYFTEADVDLRVCGVLKHFMKMIMSLHNDCVQRTRLPFANVTNPQEQANLAMIFGVEGYASTDLTQRQHIAIVRSLKNFGYEHSPAFLKAAGGTTLLANKGMSVDDLRVQLCNILGVTIFQSESVTKLSRKKHGTKSTPKKKSATPKYKTSTPSKKIMKEILKSPTLAKLFFTFSPPPHHAAKAPHAVNYDEDDDSHSAAKDRKLAAEDRKPTPTTY